MPISNSDEFFRHFPGLRKIPRPFTEASPADLSYNCFAWAVGVNNYRLDPCYPWFWPKECPREVTISAFLRAFATFGFKPCSHGRRESRYEKIVLYVKSNEPTHAARQLKNGRWASKLGKDIDIEHKVKDLEGPCYGKVAMYFRRPKQKL